MQLFSADIFKKKFFALENIKKHPQKLLIIGPQTFFLQIRPGCPNQPRIDFSYHKMSGTSICSFICAARLIYNDFECHTASQAKQKSLWGTWTKKVKNLRYNWKIPEPLPGNIAETFRLNKDRVELFFSFLYVTFCVCIGYNFIYYFRRTNIVLAQTYIPTIHCKGNCSTFIEFNLK